MGGGSEAAAVTVWKSLWHTDTRYQQIPTHLGSPLLCPGFLPNCQPHPSPVAPGPSPDTCLRIYRSGNFPPGFPQPLPGAIPVAGCAPLPRFPFISVSTLPRLRKAPKWLFFGPPTPSPGPFLLPAHHRIVQGLLSITIPFFKNTCGDSAARIDYWPARLSGFLFLKRFHSCMKHTNMHTSSAFIFLSDKKWIHLLQPCIQSLRNRTVFRGGWKWDARSNIGIALPWVYMFISPEFLNYFTVLHFKKKKNPAISMRR